MAVVFKSAPQTGAVNLLDRLGICVSLVCLVQCIALSLVIVLAPVMSLGFFGGDLFHRLLLALIMPVSLAAFWLGYLRHRQPGVLLTGAMGLSVLLGAAVFEAWGLPPLAASLLTSIGGLLLILGHWNNLRSRRRAGLRPGE